VAGGVALNAYTAGFQPQEIAENFQLQQDSAVADFHWWGAQGGSYTNDFSLTFYNDTGSGAPEATPFATVDIGDVSGTDSGLVTDQGASILKYDAVFAPLYLSAGTTYWLSITNQISAGNVSDGWYWARSVEGDGGFYADIGNGWFATGDGGGDGLAFQVTGVPAPASVALFGIGLEALGVARRKRVSLTSRTPN
jgi:hypothetical protein